jgi:hypothetical protein
MTQLWPRIRLWVVLGAAALCAGCQRAASGPDSAPAAKPAWQIRGEAMVARTRVGMSQDEVIQALGQPDKQLTTYRGGASSEIKWRYDVTTNVFVLAVFSSDQKLLSAKLPSAMPPQ